MKYQFSREEIAEIVARNTIDKLQLFPDKQVTYKAEYFVDKNNLQMNLEIMEYDPNKQ